MLNRTATTAKLSTEEELKEYENIKQIRRQNPIQFQSKFCNLFGVQNNMYGNILNQSNYERGNDFSSSGLDISDFRFGDNSNIKGIKFGGNILESSDKRDFMNKSNTSEFRTPNNK